MSRRQRDKLFSTGLQGRTSTAEQRASLTLDKRCKGGLDFAAGAGMEDFNLLPSGRSRQPAALRQSVP